VLLDAGIALAREGGPDAVVLREATRQAGVVPNAAYRHFTSRQELLQAVRAAALSALAIAMEAEHFKLRGDPHSPEFARASLRAVGTGYLRFAHAEPGLFRTAFSTPWTVQADPDPATAGWMRHTYGTHAVGAGMPLDVVQQNMGHASLDTTTGYTTSEERRRMKAAQAAWKKWPPIET
jgi:AcrR family transcriptional regulator